MFRGAEVGHSKVVGTLPGLRISTLCTRSHHICIIKHNQSSPHSFAPPYLNTSESLILDDYTNTRAPPGPILDVRGGHCDVLGNPIVTSVLGQDMF